MRRERAALARAVVVVAVLLAAVACAGPGGGAEHGSLPLTTPGGDTVTLGEHLDRPLVVNFFADWCAPCVKEMPDLEAAHLALGDRIAFLGVSLDPDPADGWALAERAGVTYPVVHDADSAVFVALGGVGMPTTVLLRPDGTVAARHVGALTEDGVIELARDAFDLR